MSLSISGEEEKSMEAEMSLLSIISSCLEMTMFLLVVLLVAVVVVEV